MSTIPAVAYFRVSTDKQETSIVEQTNAVQEYAAKRGYAILRSYVDDAVSGDDTKNRHEFQRMIADTTDKGDFKAILCWDQSRFGRFSPQEAGYWTWPLIEANIQLVTVDKGPIDWNDFTGWLTYNVGQHGKHQFLKDLSKDVARGQLEAAKNGSWLGSIPYGYRLEGPRKNRRLVFGPEHEVEVMRRIFREYVEEGRSLSEIAARLNSEGFLSPSGGANKWRFDTVKGLLLNPAYAGDYRAYGYSYGKYHQVHGGQVVTQTGRKRNPPSDWIIRRDNHQAMVDRETFDKAQAIIAKGKTGRSKYTPENNPYLLSGLLRCGKCGSPLQGLKKLDGDIRYYECGHSRYSGKDACEGTTVREDVILLGIADHLETWLFNTDERVSYQEAKNRAGALKTDDLPEAFAKVRELVAPPEKPKQDRKRLEKQLEHLKTQAAKARANLALLDAEFIPGVQEQIRQWDKERAGIEQELQKSIPPTEKAINAAALDVLDTLYSLTFCCRALTGPTATKPFREGLSEFFERADQEVKQFITRIKNHHAAHVICHTTRNGRGTGVRHVFVRGEFVLQPVGVNTRESNPHLHA
jgi:site-specific DNA recombinase